MSEKSKNPLVVSGAQVEPELKDKAQSKVIKSPNSDKPLAKELNGPKGLEPTRYGDWESKGRCYDF
ncbi:MAG: hypothetical protein ACI9FR_001409 [Cryomorphaceae bacterium]|jgi:hypothetical protein